MRESSKSTAATNRDASDAGFSLAGTRRAYIDPVALMQVKKLSVRAKAVVEGFTSGLHRSPLRGFSVEFAEYRPYAIGDDLRNLDWKLLARTDRYFVKQYEDETNRRCYLAVDQSRSMQYGSAGYSKAEYAQTLAATLAHFLTLQRDAVGVLTFGTSKSEYIPPRSRKSHLQHIMHLLGQESDGREANLDAAIAELAGLSKRRGLIVLISDMLTDPEPLFQPMGYLRGRGHEIVVLRILDRREYVLDLPNSSLLQDMETGKEIYVDPVSAREEYQTKFKLHESQLMDICHRRDARFLTVFTDQPLESVLLEFISGQQSISVSESVASLPALTKTSSAKVGN